MAKDMKESNAKPDTGPPERLESTPLPHPSAPVSAPADGGQAPGWRVLPGPQLPAELIAAGLATIQGDGRSQGLPASPRSPLGKDAAIGHLGFRRGRERDVEFTVVCGRAPVLHLEPLQLALLVELAPDPKASTVLLQAHSEGDGYRGNYGRGQMVARLLVPYSCLRVVRGVAGRLIRTEADIIRVDHYPIPRETLQVFYLLARSITHTGAAFEEMLTRYPGWLEWTIPEGLCS